MNRDPPKSRKDRFVSELLRLANDDTHGYSQKPPSGRWGPDFDCSSIVYEAADKAGYSVGTGNDKVRFTGTMVKDFKDAGFQILPFANVGISDLKIGDILLNLALHAEVYVGEGESVAATGSETGGYVGESGDQTGHEIERHPVTTFDKGWNYILRPPDDSEEEDELEEGDEEVAMTYGQNNHPWQNQPNGMYPGSPQSMTGYPMSNPSAGYPQGNLGQMNGYAQAGNQNYPHQGGYPQGGYSQPSNQGQVTYVKGMQGAVNEHVAPGDSRVFFDEDKSIFYFKECDYQGHPNIRVFSFNECTEDIPQHLSPLMQKSNGGQNQEQSTMGMNQNANLTKDDIIQIVREVMMSNESASSTSANDSSHSQQQSRNGSRPGNGRSN